MVDALLAAALPRALRERVVDARRGQPVLRRGADRDADRPRRARARGTAAGRRRASCRKFEIPDTVQAVRRGADRPAAAGREGGAPGRRGRSAASSGPGPSSSCSAGAEPDFRLLEARDFVRRRAGSSLEGEREYAIKHARHARGRLRERPEGEAGPTPRRLRGLARALRRRPRRARAAARAPLRRRRSARGRATSPGPSEPDELERLRAKARVVARAARRARRRALRPRRRRSRCCSGGRARDRRGAQAELWRELGRANALALPRRATSGRRWSDRSQLRRTIAAPRRDLRRARLPDGVRRDVADGAGSRDACGHWIERGARADARRAAPGGRRR